MNSDMHWVCCMSRVSRVPLNGINQIQPINTIRKHRDGIKPKWILMFLKWQSNSIPMEPTMTPNPSCIILWNPGRPPTDIHSRINYELSTGDKGLIAALYPKDRKESVNLVPKITISNFTKLTVTANTTRKGLVIQPSFDLKTNAKLGEVYFVARLFTTDDKYLSTKGLVL